MAPKKRILLVDDDDGFRAIVTRSLRARYIILPASEGEEAFNKAFELRPDVILLDMGMPGWDGMKTLQEIRKSPNLRSVPVMALTADNRKETVQSVLSAGADDYTLKELFHDNETAFRTKLEQLVARKVALAPIGGLK